MSDTTQPVSAEDVAAAINEHADAFELERQRRAKESRVIQAKKSRRAERQFRFLFAFFVVVALFYAYRIETNYRLVKEQAHITDQRFYAACQVRVQRQVIANDKREEFIKAIVAAAVPPKTPPEAATLTQQLRDGLLLPVEECGDPPGPFD